MTEAQEITEFTTGLDVLPRVESILSELVADAARIRLLEARVSPDGAIDAVMEAERGQGQ